MKPRIQICLRQKSGSGGGVTTTKDAATTTAERVDVVVPNRSFRAVEEQQQMDSMIITNEANKSSSSSHDNEDDDSCNKRVVLLTTPPDAFSVQPTSIELLSPPPLPAAAEVANVASTTTTTPRPEAAATAALSSSYSSTSSSSFPINDECTSLTVYAEQFIIGGFADGTVRIFDIYGKFPKSAPTTTWPVVAVRTDDDTDDEPPPSQQQRRGVVVNSNTHQTYGAVACQIYARGVHTNVKLDVKVCEDDDDSPYCFASVVRGSMECVAIDLSSLLMLDGRNNKTKQRKKNDGVDSNNRNNNTKERNVPPVRSTNNILDHLMVHRHSDAKLRGLGACTKLSSTSHHGEDRYLLLTGKSIKNIHIWSFTPPPPRNNSNGHGDDDNAVPSGASWQCLYDTATNGTTIQWMSVLRPPSSLQQQQQQQLFVCTKSEGQCIRVWDLSHELILARSATTATTTTTPQLPLRPRRPPYRDVPGTDRALAMTHDGHCYSTGVFDPGHVQVQDLSSALSHISLPKTTTDVAAISHISFPITTTTGPNSATTAVTTTGVRQQRQFHTVERVEIRRQQRGLDGGHGGRSYQQQQVLAQVSDGSVWYYYDDNATMEDGGGGTGSIVPRRINLSLSLSSPATACHLSHRYGIVAGHDSIQCLPLLVATTTPAPIITTTMTRMMMHQQQQQQQNAAAAATTMTRPREAVLKEKKNRTTVTATTSVPEKIDAQAEITVLTRTKVEECASSPVRVDFAAMAPSRTTVIRSLPPSLLENDTGDDEVRTGAPQKKRPRILPKSILNAGAVAPTAVVVVSTAATPTSRLQRRFGVEPVDNNDDADFVVVTDCCKASYRRNGLTTTTTTPGTTNSIDTDIGMVDDGSIVQSEPETKHDDKDDCADDAVQTPMVSRKPIVLSNNNTINSELRNNQGGSLLSEKKHDCTSSSCPIVVAAPSPAIPRKRQRPTICTPRKLEPQSLSAAASAGAIAMSTATVAEADGASALLPNDASHETKNSHKLNSKDTTSARKPSSSSSFLSAVDRKRLLRRRACRSQMQRIDQAVRHLTVQHPRSELNYMKSRILLAVRRVIQDLHWDGSATIASGRQRLEHEILPAFRANVLIPLLRRQELETQQPASAFDDASFFVEALAFVEALEQRSH